MTRPAARRSGGSANALRVEQRRRRALRRIDVLARAMTACTMAPSKTTCISGAPECSYQ